MPPERCEDPDEIASERVLDELFRDRPSSGRLSATTPSFPAHLGSDTVAEVPDERVEDWIENGWAEPAKASGREECAPAKAAAKPAASKWGFRGAVETSVRYLVPGSGAAGTGLDDTGRPCICRRFERVADQRRWTGVVEVMQTQQLVLCHYQPVNGKRSRTSDLAFR